MVAPHFSRLGVGLGILLFTTMTKELPWSCCWLPSCFSNYYFVQVFFLVTGSTRLTNAKILSESHNDQSLITHPNMSGEIEDALRNSARLRICLYVLIGLILVMNASLLIRLVWRLLRGSASAVRS
jgi:hypothetical protein